ncbi:type II toxin-antitoxin system death-on-curing family toxin [Leuconostoc sp. MS02]|uniref:type II toxin-antitoxin system death-on-curing family toxin n=1 Tax=Leuconostoc aquikimchii TaxID=3236804 RepID=UPI00349FC209
MNEFIIKKAGERAMGVQYRQGLNLIVNQPQQVIFGRKLYPTIWLKAVFILQKITKKHIFFDGNKRTALISTAVFLNLNDYRLVHTDIEAENFILMVKISVDSEEMMMIVANWLHEHAIKK